MRAAFRDLAAFGLPTWNPWLNGGQPLLSNPSYAAFYPPSWLVFAVSPSYLFGLLALLHGAIAFAGAWRLARHFGCGRGAAALAAVGYSGSGAYLSLLSAYTLFCSMAWFPWVLLWADQALRAPAGRGERGWWRPALLAGGALALQLLNGEPSTVVMSGLGVLALAASAAGRRPAAALRSAVPVLFAVALAAVQLLPTLGRLADSPRKDIPTWHATLWSMPPERLAEAVFPRFLGDPTRNLEGRYFGWKLEDRDYPYVESIYPGLLLTLLGAVALIRWRIPRRAAWALAVLAGFFLALGRHNPVYEALREAVPLLAVLRFPEKFAILAVLSLAFAGVLAWQRLLDERDAGRAAEADFPLALAGVVCATAGAVLLVLRLAPRAALWLIAAHGAPDLAASGRETALAYLRSEAWAALAVTAAVAALLALVRWRRPSRRLLEILAVALLAADLWHYGHGLVRTLPAAAVTVPPPLAAPLRDTPDRVFVQPAPPGVPEVVPRNWGDPRTLIARTYLARLEPYSGLLWHVPYAFNTDFDLMLTGYGRQAQKILDGEWAQPQMAYRYLGVWNVGTLVLRDPGAARGAARSRGDPAQGRQHLPRPAFPFRAAGELPSRRPRRAALRPYPGLAGRAPRAGDPARRAGRDGDLPAAAAGSSPSPTKGADPRPLPGAGRGRLLRRRHDLRRRLARLARRRAARHLPDRGLPARSAPPRRGPPARARLPRAAARRRRRGDPGRPAGRRGALRAGWKGRPRRPPPRAGIESLAPCSSRSSSASTPRSSD